jgi:branched-chain amino acid transport system ATP-binding protein
VTTDGADPLLKLSGIDTYYGQIHILESLNLHVAEGELVSLLGGNASGKSTTLKTVLGLVRPRNGSVEFRGEEITDRTTSYRIQQGMAIVPENRRLFGPMTVLENLEMGAYIERDGTRIRRALDRVCALFPILGERRSQKAGTMSGGEQQMVAIGRALMTTPKLIMLDEPSLGLAPKFVTLIFDKLTEMKRAGFTLMVVEQNAARALAVADRGYVLELGRNRFEGTGEALLADPEVKLLYLGG